MPASTISSVVCFPFGRLPVRAEYLRDRPRLHWIVRKRMIGRVTQTRRIAIAPLMRPRLVVLQAPPELPQSTQLLPRQPPALVSPSAATLIDFSASVANKRLMPKGNPFRCNTYEKQGEAYPTRNSASWLTSFPSPRFNARKTIVDRIVIPPSTKNAR
jgi:hypothetical protein